MAENMTGLKRTHRCAEIDQAARDTFKQLGREIEAYQPDLIVLFAPDHFNGFFYDLMPPFCLGLRAKAAEDWSIGRGPLDIPEDTAFDMVQAVMNDGIDLAYSYRMTVDHGFTQPLVLMCGEDLTRYPVIPVFVNGAAKPLPSCRRVVELGRAIGRFIANRDQRILIIGSGGLSHDPPTAQFRTAPEAVQEFLIAGRNPSPEARQKRQERVIGVGRAMAAGESDALPLNPEWDHMLLDAFANADFERLAAIADEEIDRMGGRGGHEIRCWIAAFAALAESGPYRATTHYYEPIDEWVAGMAMASADPL